MGLSAKLATVGIRSDVDATVVRVALGLCLGAVQVIVADDPSIRMREVHIRSAGSLTHVPDFVSHAGHAAHDHVAVGICPAVKIRKHDSPEIAVVHSAFCDGDVVTAPVTDDPVDKVPELDGFKYKEAPVVDLDHMALGAYALARDAIPGTDLWVFHRDIHASCTKRWRLDDWLDFGYHNHHLAKISKRSCSRFPGWNESRCSSLPEG